jgi:hypothetical protein
VYGWPSKLKVSGRSRSTRPPAGRRYEVLM